MPSVVPELGREGGVMLLDTDLYGVLKVGV